MRRECLLNRLGDYLKSCLCGESLDSRCNSRKRVKGNGPPAFYVFVFLLSILYNVFQIHIFHLRWPLSLSTSRIDRENDDCLRLAEI